MAAYRNLSQWLTENAGKFLSSNKTAQLRDGAFKNIKKFIVLWPHKHPRSRIENGDFKFRPFYGDVIGFDELVSRVRDHRWQSTNTVPVEPGEMVELAKALQCEPPEEGKLPVDPARQPEQTEAGRSEEGCPPQGSEPETVPEELFGTRQSRIVFVESVRTYSDKWIYLNDCRSDLSIEIFGISPEKLAFRKKYYDQFIGKELRVEGRIKADRHGRPQISIPDSSAETRLQVLD